jgi:predicted RNA-binding protein YlqC (UPF0109 family)
MRENERETEIGQPDEVTVADDDAAVELTAEIELTAEDELREEDDSPEQDVDSQDDIGEVEGEAEMRDMIGYIARVLVDDTDAVQVRSEWSDGRLNIKLKVADADKGKVIGRRGRVVHAMQSLLRVAATKSNMRAGIDVE